MLQSTKLIFATHTERWKEADIVSDRKREREGEMKCTKTINFVALF